MNLSDLQAAVSNFRAGMTEESGLTYGEARELQSYLDGVRKEERGTAREGRTPETRIAPDSGDWKVRRSVRTGLGRAG